MKNTLTTKEASKLLKVSVSRIEQHCRNKKRPLGKTFGKFSGVWVITPAEIKEFRKVGKLPPGAPRKGTQ